MADIDCATANLDGHTLCLCLNGKILTSDKKGVSPMADFIAEGTDLKGYSAADIVVGKAAAMMFVKAQIREIHAKVISKSGLAVLNEHGIRVSYDALTENIINRTGTDICPMEKAVADTDDIETGCRLIAEKLKALRSKN